MAETDTDPPRPCAACRPPAGARRTARSPIPSAASRASAPSCPRRARRGPTGGSSPRWRGAWVSATAFAYASPAEIFAEHAALSAFENDGARDFDIGAHAAIDGQAYEELDPFQWPHLPSVRATRRFLRAAEGEVAVGSKRDDVRFFANGGFYHAGPQGALRRRSTDVRNAHQRRLSAGAQHRPRARPLAHDDPHRQKPAPVAAHRRALRRNPPGRRHAATASATPTSCACPAPMATSSSARWLTARQREGSVFVPMHWTDQFSRKGPHRRARRAAHRPDFRPAGAEARCRPHREICCAGFRLCCPARPAGVDQRPTTGRWPNARTAGASSSPLLVTALIGPALRNRCSALPKARRCLLTTISKAGQHRVAAFDGDRLAGALFVAPRPGRSFTRLGRATVGRDRTTASAIASAVDRRSRRRRAARCRRDGLLLLQCRRQPDRQRRFVPAARASTTSARC